MFNGNTNNIDIFKKSSANEYLSEHEMLINHVKCRFTCRAYDEIFYENDEKDTLNIFSFSYVLSNEKQIDRPVMFIFNGGPGSSSMWLHMGLLGPYSVVNSKDKMTSYPKNCEINENTSTALLFADMVFIDPPGTGFSGTINKNINRNFWGVENDAKAINNFIQRWLTRNNRWGSERYICGESYGTTRSVMVAKYLAEDSVVVNGLILISSILDFQTARVDPGNIMPDICYLPTYAATAKFYGITNTSKTIDQVINKARSFSVDEYLPALFDGKKLSENKYKIIVKELSVLTGLDVRWLEMSNLRITPSRFRKELLRSQGLVIGRFDSRYNGYEGDQNNDEPDGDPSSYLISPAYNDAIKQYLGQHLGINHNFNYVTFNKEALKTWNWSLKEDNDSQTWPKYFNCAPELEKLINNNPKLRVMIHSGLYDLATPFFGTESTINRYNFDIKRVKINYYEGGHMMYLNEKNKLDLLDSIKYFVTVHHPVLHVSF